MHVSRGAKVALTSFHKTRLPSLVDLQQTLDLSIGKLHCKSSEISSAANMATSSVYLQTLQSITNAKLTELSKKRATFDTRHSGAISGLQFLLTPLDRVQSLLKSVKQSFDIDSKTETLHGSSDSQVGHTKQLKDDIQRLGRFLEQARFDPSLGTNLLGGWEETLLGHLHVQSQRYEYATLYGQLVKEWLSLRGTHDATVTAPSTDVDMGDGFEQLPNRKALEARAHFESLAFTPADVDESAITEYLGNLFSDGVGSEERNICDAVTAMRKSAQSFEAQLAMPSQFNHATVARSIAGLLKSGLFVGESRSVLGDFRKSPTTLSEIADVLNMRIAALSSWSWESSGVPIELRRKANGRFDAVMHEDLLQAIFLQFIGTEWSVFFQTAFGRFRRETWISNFKQISRIEKKRLQYYLGQQETDEALARLRRRTYRKGYFVHQLLNSTEQEIELNEGEEEAAFEDVEEVKVQAMTAPDDKRRKSRRNGLGVGGAKRHRRIHVAQLDDEESDDDSEEAYAPKKPMERKQDLLHLLTTEAAINERVHGSFTAFRSTFEELHSSLPHQAVVEVMEFFGVTKTWTSFFRTYLEAPLRFLDDEEGDSKVRKRRRGAPTLHILSDVFSEAMLFCADFAVNRYTHGSFLYRLADDFWFWSHDCGKAVTAWREVRKFAETMGLSLNDAKGGTVCRQKDNVPQAMDERLLPAGRIRWGMLYFDADALRFKIDQNMVDEHIAELKKQLSAKESVFEWIQVWNAYAVTFFDSNFGKAANCFGREHVDDILATHERIQKAVFDGQSVAHHVKSMIERRFGVQDVADGFLFFPVELGGLELRSPFIAPLQIRGSIALNPSKFLDEFEDREKQEYKDCRAQFDKGQGPETREDVDEPNWKPAQDADKFMSFEEYIKYREEYTTSNSENYLLEAYRELMEKPKERSMTASPSIMRALNDLRNHAHARGITCEWSRVEAYWQWVAQLHGPEIIQRFGGLTLVEPGLLPMGMVSFFRDQKVKW